MDNENLELQETPFKVYIKVNENGLVVAVNSDIFLREMTGWTKIDEGYGDKYAHAQSAYFPKPLFDENGIANYEYINGIVQERNKTTDIATMETLNNAKSELVELEKWFDEIYDNQVKQYQRCQRLGIDYDEKYGTMAELDEMAVEKAKRINEIRELLK